MHRMCHIIHTDFKPENVVICLTDEQVKEIARTGLLKNSKMTGGNEAMVRVHKKVVGDNND